MKLYLDALLRIILGLVILICNVACGEEDEPTPNPNINLESNEVESKNLFEVNGLYFSINSAGICEVTGQKALFMESITIPEEVTFEGHTYTVTEIVGRRGKPNPLNASTIVIPKTITKIWVADNGYGIKAKQLIVGEKVSQIYTNAWFNVDKIIWLQNSRPDFIVSSSCKEENLYGKINYFSSENYHFGEYKIIPNLSSIFTKDGLLYTLLRPSERKCAVIGYDYSQRSSITLPSSVTNEGITLNVDYVGPYLLSGAKTLTTVEAKCPYISEGMFSNCANLKKFEVGNWISEIEDNAFNGCNSLEEFAIEDGERSLSLGYSGSYASNNSLLYSCPIRKLKIGRPLKYWTGSSQSYSPFSNLKTLEEVTISDKEITIYDYEFYGCSKLKSLKIGDGVQTIGNYAFSGCASMITFKIGQSVKSIGKDAFSDCTSLTSLTTEAVVPPICGNQALDDIDKWKCKLYVPDESVEAYKDAPQWNNFLFIE